MDEQVNHVGFFTIADRELAGDSNLVTQPESRCSHVRCECGWRIDTRNLRDAKAMLARHQHQELRITWD